MNITTQIQNILTSGKISQRELAQKVGISGSALSTYLKGTYTGNIANVEKALQNYLSTALKKATVFVEAPNFIQIPTATRVFGALDMAKILPTMVTIYGASGVGKTKAASEYTKCNQNVWMITASPSKASLSSILYELALELGANEAPRRKDRLNRIINKKLKGTNGLVIIDESDHLPYDALEEIRIIQEESDVGFALIGNDKVYTRIQGGINQAHEYARLWSRIGNNCGIKASTKGDIKAIAQAWGLDTSDNKLTNFLYEIGTKAGGLRALTQYLRLAGMMAKGTSSPITLELIQSSVKQMRGTN